MVLCGYGWEGSGVVSGLSKEGVDGGSRMGRKSLYSAHEY